MEEENKGYPQPKIYAPCKPGFWDGFKDTCGLDTYFAGAVCGMLLMLGVAVALWNVVAFIVFAGWAL